MILWQELPQAQCLDGIWLSDALRNTVMIIIIVIIVDNHTRGSHLPNDFPLEITNTSRSTKIIETLVNNSLLLDFTHLAPS